MDNQEIQNEEIEINLAELFQVLKEHLHIIIISILICAILVGAFTIFFVSKKYESTARIFPKPEVNEGIVDYSQINSNNLVGLGLSVDDIFKPCINLRASQTILKACYDSALKSYPAGQVALRHALSCYNTGSLTNGISNGYVTKVINVARQSTDLKIPTLLPDGQTSEDSTANEPQQAKSTAPQYDGEQDVFGSGDGDAFSRNNTDAFLTRQETAKGE